MLEELDSDYATDDVDVFASAERSARPPEPGRLELPAPIGRAPAKNTELTSWIPSSLRDLGPNDPAARLAVAAVAGVVVSLVIAVIGLRVTGGSETEVSTGSLGLQSTEGEAEGAPVGSYVGRSIDAARADAAANDWELNTIRVWRNDTALGEVVEQAPLAGTPLEVGGRLDLVVSQGPELLPIPPVVGRNADEAIEMLSEAGLVVGTVTEVEGEAAPGEVIATAVQNAPPGTDVVESGSVVDLVVRARGDAKPMPSFVGLTVDQAIDQANDLGVELKEVAVESSRWGVGLVADTDPPTDTPIRPGDRVTIFVSTGPAAASG